MGSGDGTSVYRSFVSFQPERVPGAVISSATLGLYQYAAASCSPQAMSVQPLSAGFYQNATSSNAATVWANQPAPNTSSDWVLQPSFNTGKSGCSPAQPAGFESVDVTKMVAGYDAGDMTAYGWELTAPWGSGELNTAAVKYFCSDSYQSSPDVGHCDTVSEEPTLSLTYTPELGLQSSFPLTAHRLNDRSTVYVNNDDGDAVLAANDLDIRGVGMDLGVGRYYNSLSTATGGVFGAGWTMSVGPDVLLKRRGSGTPGSWFDYQAPSGTMFGTFVQKGSTSSYYKAVNGGLDASLGYDSASGDYKMTFDKSRMVYWFSGCSSCDQHLVKQTDRHGNAISYTYNGSSQLTSITDTEGRALTLSYNGDGTLAAMSDVSGRAWSYSYTAGQLTGYTDPDHNVTNYAYTGGLLTSITDPPGSDATADRANTTLAYTGGQVTSLAYAKDSAAGSYQFSYVYGLTSNSSLSACCPSSEGDEYSTDVTDNSDPQGGTTTYCFDYPYLDQNYAYTGAQQRVYDGDGHKRSIAFSPDNSISTSTDANNSGTGGASTVLGFAGALSENLTSVTEPGDTGNTGGTTQLSYDDTANNPYLPTSVQNSNGNCTRSVYSAGGDLTDTYAGLAGSDCSATTGGTHNHLDYNSDGTVKDSYNPNGGTSTETTYAYYSPTNDGGHAYLDGQLYWVVKPGGVQPTGTAGCSATTSLCTSFSYDQLDRVTTTTDGNNNTTTLHYDGLDHVTEVDLAGAGSCNGGHSNCDSYSYDAEGNVVSVTDTSNRARSIGYDRLNRETSETVPGTSNTITDSYDGAGNMVSYKDGADTTVSYGYDAANDLTSITDAAGTFHQQNDNDGNRLQITEPNGVTIATSYHANNQVKTISTSGGSGLPASYTYSYTLPGTSKETGQVQKLAIGSTSTTYYGYDTNDRLCWTGTASFTGCTTTAARSYGYGYDADGDLTTATTGSVSSYYGYRDNGELCYSGATSGTAVAASCPSTPSGDTTYTNDTAGNLTGTTSNPASLTYNTDNQATSLAPLATGTPTVAATYADHGNQIRSANGSDSFDNGPLGITALTNTSGTTYYTRDPHGNLLDERGPTGTFYYLTDRQNSVLTLISATGTDAGDYTYDPYGKLTNAGSLTTTTAANPFRYTSGYQDTEGDNYYHLGARYYDPTIARFTQPDSVNGSISNPRTINPYTYSGDDPLNAADPSGNDFFSFGVSVNVGPFNFGAGIDLGN